MKITTHLLALLTSFLFATVANAVPVLQVYLEGATYDDASETWVADGDTIRLWTIGNVAAKGSIYDVKLSIAYAAGLTPAFTLTPSTTGGYGGYSDPSTPGGPTLLQTNTSGASPLLGDGSPLPAHGIYGAGTWWQEYALGDFTLTDSQIADFIDTFPAASGSPAGQINVYEISMTGAPADSLFHFDLYDHVEAGNHAKYKFAPFSHDGEAGSVPEPGKLLLLGLALLLITASLRRRPATTR